MDKKVIALKLDNLSRCTQRIEDKLPSSLEILETDPDLQDIVSLNVERAVQNCIDIASHIAVDFDDVTGLSAAGLFMELIPLKVITEDVGQRLASAAGFRNLLVHRYASIDWKQAFESIRAGFPVFREFARQISEYCELS